MVTTSLTPGAESGGEFAYIRIPCDATKPMEELKHARNTCLEDDDLREVLKYRFANNMLSAEQMESYVAGLQATIAEKVPDGGGLDAAQLRSLAGAVSVDTYALTVPSKAEPVAVSLYCDEKSHAKQLPLNERAIGLAAACGAQSQQFRGDCYVSRYFDDDDAWVRQDLTLGDCSSDAAWVARAAEVAKTSKSPGGMASLSAMYEKLGAGGGQNNLLKVDAAAEEAALMDAEHAEATYSWTQTEGDVEVRVPVAPGTAARDLAVALKRTSLRVAAKADAKPLVDVTTLAGAIDVDCSTWYVDGAVVVVTLEKASGGRWDSLGDVA